MAARRHGMVREPIEERTRARSAAVSILVGSAQPLVDAQDRSAAKRGWQLPGDRRDRTSGGPGQRDRSAQKRRDRRHPALASAATFKRRRPQSPETDYCSAGGAPGPCGPQPPWPRLCICASSAASCVCCAGVKILKTCERTSSCKVIICECSEALPWLTSATTLE